MVNVCPPPIHKSRGLGKHLLVKKCLSHKQEDLIDALPSHEKTVDIRPVNPVLGRWRKEDQEFKDIFSYLVNSPVLKNGEGWGDGSSVNSIDCSSRGSVFNSQ